MAYTLTQVFGGGFQNAIGQPLSNGWLTLQLSHDESVALPASQVVGGVSVKIFLDQNGNAAPNQSIWTSDLLNPNSSYYTVEAYGANGLKVWLTPQYWMLTSGFPIDLGSIVPFNP